MLAPTNDGFKPCCYLDNSDLPTISAVHIRAGAKTTTANLNADRLCAEHADERCSPLQMMVLNRAVI